MTTPHVLCLVATLAAMASACVPMAEPSRIAAADGGTIGLFVATVTVFAVQLHSLPASSVLYVDEVADAWPLVIWLAIYFATGRETTRLLSRCCAPRSAAGRGA